MSNNYVIKRIECADLGGIAEVERACFSTPWSEESLKMLLEESNVGFVALLDGKIVGYGGMQCVLDEGQIIDIAVSPEYRRRGIAAAILARLLWEARARRLSVLFLEVRESNLPALSLYRDRFGFECIGVRRGFYSHPREDALNMRLLLSAEEHASGTES